MMKKTITVLMVLSTLLLLLAACENQEMISTSTSESSASLSTSVQTDAPTEVETAAPTEACTHEWETVVNERCKVCGEIHKQTEDSEYVRYHFGGIFTVARFEEEENVRECTDRAFLSLLNEKQWKKGDLTGYYLGGFEYVFNFDGNLRLYYSSFDGKFSNYLDCTYVELTEEERQTVNNLLTALFPASLSGQTVDRIELVYHGNLTNAHTIEDEQEIERLMEYICEIDAKQIGDSTAGHYGVSFSLELYAKEKKIAGFWLWDKKNYSTWHYNEKVYAYFYHGDISEIYDYLDEHYPEEFWYGDQ
ncbi:MAG: hypothetical protein IKM52_03675 [Clostridia bacterium]|nr:hypothetical protein [Clostridia bacterium]